jgi:hypothetical protein
MPQYVLGYRYLVAKRRLLISSSNKKKNDRNISWLDYNQLKPSKENYSENIDK